MTSSRLCALRGFVFSSLAALFVTLMAACQAPPALPQDKQQRFNAQDVTPSLELRSTSFSGDTIPKTYTCDGPDTSPELSWKSPPERTQSFALIVIDKDSWFGSGSIFGYFAHWVLYDLPADKRELPEGTAKLGQLPDGSRQGQNDFDKIGYVGPCPPTSSHRYVFTLYALDTKPSLPSGVSKKEVLKAMNGHVLAQGELIGRYHR